MKKPIIHFFGPYWGGDLACRATPVIEVKTNDETRLVNWRQYRPCITCLKAVRSYHKARAEYMDELIAEERQEREVEK